MRKLAVIQSNYIPWKGYFDIIHDVDMFIFYDDVQYTKNDWRNRNKIKTTNGVAWLTIPVGKRDDRLIYEVEMPQNAWQSKHWATLKQFYSKAPYFSFYQEFFEFVYIDSEWSHLSELNQFLVKEICRRFLGIMTEFQDSRQYQPEGDRIGRLLDLILKAGGDYYLSGPTARDYLDREQFKSLGIDLVYKDYAGYPEYSQLFPPFEHAVSIVDLLFNCGPDAPYFIWGWRENLSTPPGM